ncbi:hypothetical protein CK203_102064 [Vitis vinifera]|uniref:Uncharacterized protein n=1 Tax=Vitis vinifera TaxID=29760 RepID=A0A438EJQ2_VITVI|nr:hypothetical protein CK203_102064 [Vitis vinifera]
MERETRAVPKVSGLTQRLFSWSLEDIQNEDLYKTQLVLCWIMILKLAIGYSPTLPELGSFIYRPSQFTCSSVEAFLVYGLVISV